MSLEVIRGGRDLDAYEQLVDALRRVIEQIVDERMEKREARQPAWRWLTAQQAGEILGISPAAVAARVRRGTLDGRIYQRRIYVDRTALDTAIAG